MNYLAHLYLADDDADSLIGSLLGDFARGRIDDRLPRAQRLGVMLHRRIDSYTDAHPVFQRSRQRLSPGFRRYGGVLIDIFYDHFLARDWSDWADVALADFTTDVYRILRQHRHTFPPRMQRSVVYMLRHDLLRSYGDIAAIHRSLHGIEGRLRRPVRLRDAVADLEHHYDALAQDFRAFFPELIAHVEHCKRDIGDATRG